MVDRLLAWPLCDGWDEALRPVVGRPHLEIGGYEVVGRVVNAVSYLRPLAKGEKITEPWLEAVALFGG